MAPGRGSRPLICVTGRRLELGRVQRWLEPAVASPSFYVEAVTRAGGWGAVVGPESLDAGGAAALMDRLDGLLLTGGVDVEPDRYGEQRAPQTYGCDRLTDDFELALLRAAFAADRPVLAICRGAQLLNVACGGTLCQHITGVDGLLDHGAPAGGGGADVVVEIEAGSRLDGAMKGPRATGRCHHHQAIDRLGHGLSVSARAADGIVEGIERTGAPWVVGVQWHPEDSAERDRQQQALFDRFVVEAAAP